MTQEDVAFGHDVSIRTITRLEAGQTVYVTPANGRRIARALRMDEADFWNTVQADTEAVARNIHEARGPGVEIPWFKAQLAASRWIEVHGSQVVDYRTGRATEATIGESALRRKLFRCEISGDCMEPDWKSGTLVEFMVVPLEDVEPRMDIYLQKSDGLATFKRVVEVRPEAVILSPINKSYRIKYEVPIQEIVRVAAAIGEVRIRRTW